MLLSITALAATDSSDQAVDNSVHSNTDDSTLAADTTTGDSKVVSKNTDDISTESENELKTTDTAQSSSDYTSSQSTSKSDTTQNGSYQSDAKDSSSYESDTTESGSYSSDNTQVSSTQTSNTQSNTNSSESSSSEDISTSNTQSSTLINNTTSVKSLKTASQSSVSVKVNSINASVYDSVVLTANVTASNGVVVNNVEGVFKLNDVTVGYATVNNGVAKLTYTVENWVAKDYDLSFKVGETETTKTGEGHATFTIYKSAVKVGVTSLSTMPNSAVTFKASVNYTNGTPVTGNIKGVFKINGVTYGYAYVNDGVASYTFSVPAWSAKDYNVTFTIGESRYSLSGTGKGVMTINKDDVVVTLSSYTSKPNTTITLKATAYYSQGVALDGAKVSFKLNDKTIGSTRVSNGVAQINYTTPSLIGSQNLTVIIGESGSSKTATANSKLVLCDTGVIELNDLYFSKQGNELTVKVTVVGKSGASASDGKVCLKVNGKTVDTKSVSNGLATFTYDTSKLSKGTHNITVIYGSSTYLTSANATSNLRIESNTTKFTYQQILQKANDTKVFIEKNYRLPNFVTIGSTQVSVEDFLYLLCEVYAGNNSYYSGGFGSATTSKTNCNGSEITKSDYILLAQSVVDCYAQNGRTPHSFTVGNLTMNFEDAFYFYTRAVAFIYNNNGSLSNYGTVISVSGLNSSSSGTSGSTNKVPSGYEKYVVSSSNCQVNNSAIKSAVNSAIKGVTGTYNQAVAIFNYVNSKTSYSGYYNTKYGAVGTLNRGYGNCCDLSHLLVAMFRTANIPARYCHAKCTFSSGSVIGHVWVEVYVDGKWYSCDASSSRNSFGVIRNWSKSTSVTRYVSLPF